MKTHYEILGISQDASPTEIKEAAQANANEIKVIFDVLSDADKRQAYDNELKQASSSLSNATNYYEILAITQDASSSKIKEAAQIRMDKMKTAFSILYDTNKRKAYDLELNPTLQPVSLPNSVGGNATEFREKLSPYQPPAVPIVEVAEKDFELAGRGSRLGAYVMDSILVIFPVLIVFALGMGTEVLGIGAREVPTDETMVNIFSIFIFLWFMALFVINMILLYQNGQTIGKRMLSIKIVRVDGSRAELLRIIFLRALPTGLLSSIPAIGNLFFLIDALLIFQDSRRCLHDLIAGTIVIRASSNVDSTGNSTSLSA